MHRKRFLTVFAVVGLGLLTVFAVIGLASRQAAQAGSAQAALPSERAAYYQSLLQKNMRRAPYAAMPREDIVYEEVALDLPPNATKADLEAAVQRYYRDFGEYNNKVSRPNPLARLGRQKQLERAAELQAQGIEVSTALTGTPQLLTVMMNFSGSETFSAGDEVAFHGVCLDDPSIPPTFTVTIEGPAFNETEQPDDNWTPWLDPNDSYTGGFTQEYFQKLMFSTEGYTQTMRPELPNPWTGGNGFDFSGVSFRNWYEENSRGVYVPEGDVVEVIIPEPVSKFGAARCNGRVQDDGYYGPAWRVAISAAEQINAEFPGFDWTTWDQEDVFDWDDDGDFNEPDGYVDHFFLLEAGYGQGGPYDEFSIWPHSWDVNLGDTSVGPSGFELGGYKVSDDGPRGGVWILNYTVSDEVGGLGVLVHEYGHDIGLPDNYAVAGTQGSNTGFWDQMDSGTFGGGLSGMHPAHHTIWDKAEPYLGWNEPVEIDIETTAAIGEENAIEFVIGQQSKPPAGTIDGLRIVLPDLVDSASVEPFDDLMWHSDRGDDRKESIGREFTPQAGEEISITADLAYFIEEDWDYLFWEYSTDDGATWTQLPVFSEGSEITVNTNPNGNNPDNDPAITGTSGGWISATATIDPGDHGGDPTWFRFRYFTDAAVQEEGVYLDNISIDGSASGNIFFDDAEGGDQWTHFSEGINTENPWYIYDGVNFADQSYLVEWRNSGEGTGANGDSDELEAFEIAGFDIGLNRMYWIDEFDESGDIASVDPFFQHTPGMVVYFLNGRYSDNSVGNYLFDHPSYGPKGRVLVVDANPDPFFVDDADLGPRAVSERRSSFDAAYTLVDRPSFELSSNVNQVTTDTVTTIPGADAKPTFRDRIGVTPGIEGVPPAAFFVDADAGVVLPTRGDVPYWAYWDVFGDLGNPGVNGFGVNLEVVEVAEDGTWGRVRFWLDDDTVFVDSRASSPRVEASEPVSVTIQLKDGSGSRYSDSHQHTFSSAMVASLPEGMDIISGSVSLTGNGSLITDLSALAEAGFDISALEADAGQLILSLIHI